MTVELSEDLGASLLAVADRWGQTPGELAAWLLREELERIEANIDDPGFQERADALKVRMAEGARQVRDEIAAEKLAARILSQGEGAD